MSKRKPHNDRAGYRAERRNRVTGAYTAIVDQQLTPAEEISQAWGLNEQARQYLGCCHRYVVICTHHQIASSATSMPKARKLMLDPSIFCDRCSAQDVICRTCRGTGDIHTPEDLRGVGAHGIIRRCQECDGDGRRRVPCRFCSAPTPMTGTRHCDNCHEIHARIRTMPRKILGLIVEDAYPGDVDLLTMGPHGGQESWNSSFIIAFPNPDPSQITDVDLQLSRGGTADPREGGVRGPADDAVTRSAEDCDSAGADGPF